MFFKMQNIGQMMHLTMLIAHPYFRTVEQTKALIFSKNGQILLVLPVQQILTHICGREE